MYALAVLLLLVESAVGNLPNKEELPDSQFDEGSDSFADDSSLMQWSFSLKRTPAAGMNASEPATEEQQGPDSDSIPATAPEPTHEHLRSKVRKMAVKRAEKNRTHPPSFFPSSWLCLGPFNPREYGTDPLRAWGSIQDVASRVPTDLWDAFHIRSEAFDRATGKGITYKKSLHQVSNSSGLQPNLSKQQTFPNFPSETGFEGRTKWIMAYTDFARKVVPADFKKAMSESGMDMKELHYIDSTGKGSGWAIGEINVTKDTTLLIRCSDYFHIDDSVQYMYDSYGERRSVHVVHLKKGAHRMYVNFYTSSGFFCDVFKDTQEAREVVTGLPASFNEIEVFDFSDGKNHFIPLVDVAVSHIVKGWLASSYLGIPVLNAATKTLFLGHAKIIDGPKTLQVEANDTTPVMQGQISILKLRIHHKSKIDGGEAARINFTVALYPRGEGNESYSPTKVQVSIPCRESGGTVAYPDFDGSIQMLWVEPPNISRFANGSCPAAGCPMLLSLHGSDVDTGYAWGDTYRYEGPESDGLGFPYPAWLVQPSNRWRWGTDWEQQGFDNLLYAVQYVEEFLPLAPGKTLAEKRACCGLDSRLILTTGHSMGGHGCEVFSTHFPDRLIGVACAAAWGSFASYSSGGQEPLLIDGHKRGLVTEVWSENNAEFLSANLRGIPMHAFYGSADESVPTTENKLMAQLVSSASGDPFAVNQTELPGVSHWFEQDVPEMVAFYEKMFKPGSVALPQFPEAFQFTATSASYFGSRGHLKMLEKVMPSRPAEFFVERCTGAQKNSSQNQICKEALKQFESDSSSSPLNGGDPLWVVQTSNVQHIVLELAEESVLGRAWPQALQLDGKVFKALALNETYHLCNYGSWHICSESEIALPEPPGKVDMAIRGAPVCIIHGSGPGQQAEALRLAHKLYFISRYSVPILEAGNTFITDAGGCFVPYGCDKANLIFIGSPSENPLMDCFKCAFPYVRFFEDPETEISGFAVGGNAYVHNRSAVLAVGILPTTMRTALLLHGNSAEGLARAVDTLPVASHHDFNDFMVFGPEYGWQGQGGLLASGFLDSKWRIATAESWLVPEHSVKAEFPLVEAPDGEDPSCVASAFWQRIRSQAPHGVTPSWVLIVCCNLMLAFLGRFYSAPQ